eukprot:1794084-Amphidinium_carterae.1
MLCHASIGQACGPDTEARGAHWVLASSRPPSTPLPPGECVRGESSTTNTFSCYRASKCSEDCLSQEPELETCYSASASS